MTGKVTLAIIAAVLCLVYIISPVDLLSFNPIDDLGALGVMIASITSAVKAFKDNRDAKADNAGADSASADSDGTHYNDVSSN